MAPWLMAVVAFLAVSLPALALVIVVGGTSVGVPSPLTGLERMQPATIGGSGFAGELGNRIGAPLAAGGAPLSTGVVGAIGGLLAQLATGRRLLAWAERDLEFTEWTLTPSAYLFRRLLLTLLAGISVWWAVRQPMAFVVAIVVTHVLAGRLIARRRLAYQRRVGRQTEAIIDILVAHLRAGQSLGQSLGALAEEAPSPARQEYGRVARQLALGTPISEALRGIERRVPVMSVALLISALTMHHRIGGDLPLLLGIAADTVRDQVRLQDDLRTAAAGQMLAAYVVVALPILLFAVLFLIDRPYISGLLQPGWNLLLVLGGVMEIVGFFVMRSFTRMQF